MVQIAAVANPQDAEVLVSGAAQARLLGDQQPANPPMD